MNRCTKNHKSLMSGALFKKILENIMFIFTCATRAHMSTSSISFRNKNFWTLEKDEKCPDPEFFLQFISPIKGRIQVWIFFSWIRTRWVLCRFRNGWYVQLVCMFNNQDHRRFFPMGLCYLLTKWRGVRSRFIRSVNQMPSRLSYLNVKGLRLW